jgi:hypothetical protein
MTILEVSSIGIEYERWTYRVSSTEGQWKKKRENIGLRLLVIRKEIGTKSENQDMAIDTHEEVKEHLRNYSLFEKIRKKIKYSFFLFRFWIRKQTNRPSSKSWILLWYQPKLCLPRSRPHFLGGRLSWTAWQISSIRCSNLALSKRWLSSRNDMVRIRQSCSGNTDRSIHQLELLLSSGSEFLCRNPLGIVVSWIRMAIVKATITSGQSLF